MAGAWHSNSRLCWVDVHAFNDALATAEKALAGVGSDVSSWVEARQWTMKGVELYRGPFLGEDGEQAWAAPIADRIRARWVRHLCALVDHSMRTEQWEDAIETCLVAIEADPCAEPAYVRMMTAYVRTGRRAEALRTYERCRSVLARQSRPRTVSGPRGPAPGSSRAVGRPSTPCDQILSDWRARAFICALAQSSTLEPIDTGPGGEGARRTECRGG